MVWHALSPHNRGARASRQWRRTGIVALLGLALAIAACGPSTGGGGGNPAQPTATAAATASPTPAPCVGWRAVASPNPTGYAMNKLYAVSALSPSAAWAVGGSSQDGGATHSLIEQWDGSAWRIIPSAGGDALNGVAALSPHDVWAVGGQVWPGAGAHPNNALIMHWDGTQWSTVPSPNTGYPTELDGVVAIAANDVWAVGAFDKGTISQPDPQPLIERWDGTAWHIISGPASNGGQLRAIAPIPGTNQLWAVGYTTHGDGAIHNQALIERWNGTSWQVVTGPVLPPDASGMDLHGVVALSATDAWVVGRSYSSGAQDIIAHWDGTAWRFVARPAMVAPLAGVAAAGPHDVRAVGWIAVLGTLDAMQHVIIEQWDGTVWQTVTTPDPGATTTSVLSGITTDSAGHYWAVGDYFAPGGGDSTLTLRCP